MNPVRTVVSLRRSWRSASVALLLAAAASAQWASLATAPADPVYAQGFQVLTVTGGQAHVFSAMTRAWRALGPCFTGGYATPALQSGDFVALLRMSDHDYRAYSARLDQYADIHFDDLPDAVTVRVEDDVILMLGTRETGHPPEAWGYSGQTNRWEGKIIAPCSVATSRFVLGLKIDGVNQAFGFSARYGHWVELIQYGGELAADGNVLLLKGAAPDPSAAFSGVLGMWTVSPAQHGTSVPALAHNVAYVRAAAAGPTGQVCAYSAYSGRWFTGGAAGAERLTDNTVLVDLPPAVGNKSFRAFGARPGGWATLNLPVSAGIAGTANADAIVIDEPAAARLHGFSGLCDGNWKLATYTGAITLATTPEHLALGRDSAGTVHVFSPMAGAFAPTLAFPGAAGLSVGACQAVIENTTARHAYCLRRNAWVAGPAKDPLASHVSVCGGSAYGERNQTSGELVLFHERAGQWHSSILPGAGIPNRYAGRNVILLDATGLLPAGGMLGFSAQRGDLVPAPGFAGAPLAAPVLEENVAWVRDAAGTLHAFGSPADTHTFFQWPLDTEYQVFSSTAVPPVPMKTMVRGTSGDVAFLLLALAPSYPGLAIPGVGTLYLDPASLLLPPLIGGTVGSNGLIAAPIELAVPGAPGSAGLCQQALRFLGATPALAELVSEPARFF